jgi:hypothetical protein
MKTEGFKKGQKVVFTGLGKCSSSSSWKRWAAIDSMKVGETYVINHDSSYSASLEGKIYAYEPFFFTEWKPDIVCVILRRKSNWKAVAKVLSEAGFTWAGGEKVEAINPYNRASRLAHLKIEDRKCYFASITGKSSMKPAQIVKKHTDEVIGMDADGTKVAFINTKPSVKQAINELKLYI